MVVVRVTDKTFRRAPRVPDRGFGHDAYGALRVQRPNRKGIASTPLQIYPGIVEGDLLDRRIDPILLR
jgi:hypothetical protein